MGLNPLLENVYENCCQSNPIPLQKRIRQKIHAPTASSKNP